MPLIIIIVSAFWFYTFMNTKRNESLQEMSHYWSCMDGCSNMEDIINGKPKYDDTKAKFRHDVCARICCKQYMTILECVER